MTDRELDVLVAEKVMGCVVSGETMGYKTGDNRFPEGVIWAGALPHYSTDIAAAWLVVEKLWELHKLSFSITLKEGDGWEASFAGWEHGISDIDTWGQEDEGQEVYLRGESGRGDDAPMAICLASLKAVGVEVPA